MWYQVTRVGCPKRQTPRKDVTASIWNWGDDSRAWEMIPGSTVGQSEERRQKRQGSWHGIC